MVLQVVFRELPGRGFERGADGVVPAIEKPVKRDDGDELDQFLVGEIAAQFGEILVRYRVWHLTGALGKTKGRPFGVAEQRARFIVPDGLDLFRRDALAMGARCRM